MIKKVIQVYITLLSFFVIGCQSVPDAQPNDPRYAPVEQYELIPPQQHTGSIFQNGYFEQLWTDQRARRVGDVITVLLQESTTSNKSHATTISKDSDVSNVAPTLLGTTPSLKAGDIFTNSSSNLDLSTSIDSSRAFSGNADADQSNSLTGSITVTVSEVLPNGLLRVRGEKWLTLSTGEEFIRVTGLIRPLDIQTDNTILSNQIADSRITYSGTGDFAEVNRQGWLAKLFNSRYWPF